MNGIFAMFVALLLLQTPSAFAEKTQLEPAMSIQERQLLRYFLLEDVDFFFDGRNSDLQWIEGERLQIADIEQAYSENQVAGDRRFYKKHVAIRGTVSSINSGIGNSPYLVMSSRKMFTGPQLHIAEGEDLDRIAKLKKGDQIAMACVGGGSLAGTPMLKDCRFPESYANEIVHAIEREAESFYEGRIKITETQIYKMVRNKDDREEAASTIFFVTPVIAQTLPPFSACFIPDQGPSCAKALQKISYRDNDIKKLADVIARSWREKGIPVPKRFSAEE